MPVEVADKFFVAARLDDRPLPLAEGNIHSLEVTESIDNLLPMVKLDYSPPEPLQEFKPVTGRNAMELVLSKSRQQNTNPSQDYEIFSVSVDKNNTQETTNPALVLKGVHGFVGQLLRGQRKSYSGIVSNGVESLVSQITRNYQIESTHEKETGPYIQPGWSNAKQLRYFEGKALTKKGIGLFYPFFRNSIESQGQKTEFLFQSADNLYSQDVARNGSGSKVQLVFGGSADGEDTKEEGDPQDGQATYNVTVDFEHAIELDRNIRALGTEAAGYDYDNAEHVMEESKINEINNHVIMSDKLFFKDTDLITSGSVSRDGYKQGLVSGDFTQEVQYDADQLVIEDNAGMLRLPVVVRDSVPNVGAGSKIQLVIVDSEVSSGFQKVMSGDWIVHTKIDYVDTEYFTKLILMREGINSPRNNPEQFDNANSV
jgi:hypothetical protein